MCYQMQDFISKTRHDRRTILITEENVNVTGPLLGHISIKCPNTKKKSHVIGEDEKRLISQGTNQRSEYLHE